MTNQQGAPEAPKGTASDGKTELFNVPGYPLMVRAVDFNRLHAENERLAALVEAQQPAAHVQKPAEIEHVAGDVSKNGPESNMAQQPAPSAAAEVENLRKALQFYADKDHFNIADDGAWDTVSGEPQNYWCDEEGTATVEDGTIARLALAGHQIKFDADEAPQPSPTPQADESPIPTDYGGEPRIGCGLEGAHPKIVWIANTAYAMRNMHTLDGTWRGQLITMAAAANFVAKQIAALEPTPQADSAPSAAAPVGEAPLPLLVRDIAADLGTTPIQVCTALAQLGFGGHSVNMAVTPRMAKSLRAYFASTTPQAHSVLEDAALSSEQQRAIFEAYESAASESYFEVRPQIDCSDRRRVFKAGYERGWDAARKQGGA